MRYQCIEEVTGALVTLQKTVFWKCLLRHYYYYATVQKVKSIDNVAALNDLLLCAKFALRMLS